MISSRHDKEYGGEEEKKTMKRKRKRGATGRKGIRERERGFGGQSIERERASHVLPGLANMLINGVNSEGLLRWAMCSLRPAGPGTPPV